MTQDEIIEGNKLIGNFLFPNAKEEFLKLKVSDEIDIDEFMFQKGTMIFEAFENLKYHSSWDWLMPVIEKIEKMVTKDNVRINVLIGSNSCLINPNVHPEHIICNSDGVKINATWKTVIEFIKWYNKQNK